MNKATLYLNLCTEFFDLDKPTPPKEDYDFYLAYVKQAEGPILEPMCGSGRYLIPMLELGYTIDGFDASPFMLSSLHKKCAEKKLTPHIWQEFLQNITCHQRYSLIFIPDSSLCLLLKPIDIVTALQKLYDALTPNGTLVFDLETIYATPAKIDIWHKKTHVRADGKQIILHTLPLAVEDQIATVLCRYELVDKTEVIKTEIEHFQIRLYHPAEMVTILQAVGFKDIKCIKAYNQQSEPDPYDYTVVYECKK